MHGPSYPIEKPKPFAERARVICKNLDRVRDAILIIHGQSTVEYWMRKAQELLEEAIQRGVKGKESA